MCILELYSDIKSFKEFSKTSNLKNFKISEKGEYKNELKKSIFENYVITFNISNKEFNDLNGQIEDAINFHKNNFDEINELISESKITYAFISFPINIKSNFVIKRFYFPKELLILAGNLNIGIESALYNENRFY